MVALRTLFAYVHESKKLHNARVINKSSIVNNQRFALNNVPFTTIGSAFSWDGCAWESYLTDWDLWCRVGVCMM